LYTTECNGDLRENLKLLHPLTVEEERAPHIFLSFEFKKKRVHLNHEDESEYCRPFRAGFKLSTTTT
jgi:hypothetical protein